MFYPHPGRVHLATLSLADAELADAELLTYADAVSDNDSLVFQDEKERMPFVDDFFADPVAMQIGDWQAEWICVRRQYRM